jgi:hypothetical protein
MHALKDMAMDEDEKLDFDAPIKMEAPEYSYGLRICLGDGEIAKLGIKPEDASVGGSMMAHCLIKITSVSCDERDDGKHYRIEGQIEQMAIDGTEEEEAPRRRLSLAYNKG